MYQFKIEEIESLINSYTHAEVSVYDPAVAYYTRWLQFQWATYGWKSKLKYCSYCNCFLSPYAQKNTGPHKELQPLGVFSSIKSDEISDDTLLLFLKRFDRVRGCRVLLPGRNLHCLDYFLYDRFNREIREADVVMLKKRRPITTFLEENSQMSKASNQDEVDASSAQNVDDQAFDRQVRRKLDFDKKSQTKGGERDERFWNTEYILKKRCESIRKKSVQKTPKKETERKN